MDHGFQPRKILLGAAAFAAAIALLVVFLGYRYDLETDRIIAEGRLAQGEFLRLESGSCSGDDGCESDRLYVSYEVGGATYQVSMFVTRPGRSEAIFQPEIIHIPRLGAERLHQVVYLPSDPATARLRADISKSDIAIYGTAGMFLFIALFFAAGACFVFPNVERDRAR